MVLRQFYFPSPVSAWLLLSPISLGFLFHTPCRTRKTSILTFCRLLSHHCQPGQCLHPCFTPGWTLTLLWIPNWVQVVPLVSAKLWPSQSQLKSHASFSVVSMPWVDTSFMTVTYRMVQVSLSPGPSSICLWMESQRSKAWRAAVFRQWHLAFLPWATQGFTVVSFSGPRHK